MPAFHQKRTFTDFLSRKVFSLKLRKRKRVDAILIRSGVSCRLGAPRPPTLKTIAKLVECPLLAQSGRWRRTSIEPNSRQNFYANFLVIYSCITFYFFEVYKTDGLYPTPSSVDSVRCTPLSLPVLGTMLSRSESIDVSSLLASNPNFNVDGFLV